MSRGICLRTSWTMTALRAGLTHFGASAATPALVRQPGGLPLFLVLGLGPLGVGLPAGWFCTAPNGPVAVTEETFVVKSF